MGSNKMASLNNATLSVMIGGNTQSAIQTQHYMKWDVDAPVLGDDKLEMTYAKLWAATKDPLVADFSTAGEGSAGIAYDGLSGNTKGTSLAYTLPELMPKTQLHVGLGMAPSKAYNTATKYESACTTFMDSATGYSAGNASEGKEDGFGNGGNHLAF